MTSTVVWYAYMAAFSHPHYLSNILIDVVTQKATKGETDTCQNMLRKSAVCWRMAIHGKEDQESDKRIGEGNLRINEKMLMKINTLTEVAVMLEDNRLRNVESGNYLGSTYNKFKWWTDKDIVTHFGKAEII